MYNHWQKNGNFIKATQFSWFSFFVVGFILLKIRLLRIAKFLNLFHCVLPKYIFIEIRLNVQMLKINNDF